MSISSSNISQRRYAILRATFLMLILMSLTGYLVSRFPLAEYYQQEGIKLDYITKKDSLDEMLRIHNSLLKSLTNINNQYGTIMQLDSTWESEKIKSVKEGLVNKIKGLEKNMANSVDDISRTKNDTATGLISRAYQDLLVCRALIWDSRTHSNGADKEDCCEDLKSAESITSSMADRLEKVADEITNAGPKLFDKKRLNKIAEDLNRKAHELRVRK